MMAAMKSMNEFDNNEELTEEFKLELERKSPPSVIYTNYRSIYPDNYPAKFDDEVARKLIAHYTDDREIILDPFAGSGVIPIEAIKMNRLAIAFDTNPQAIDLMNSKIEELRPTYRRNISFDITIKKKDSRKMPLNDNSVDCEITSPPFGNVIDAKHDKYSNVEISVENQKGYEGWRKGMQEVMKEMFRVLKPNRIAIMEIRDRYKQNHGYPLFFWLIEDAFSVGFEWHCMFIEINNVYRMWSFGAQKERKPMPYHSYLLVFKKPENEKLQ